jgi:hypothetical protein
MASVREREIEDGFAFSRRLGQESCRFHVFVRIYAAGLALFLSFFHYFLVTRFSFTYNYHGCMILLMNQKTACLFIIPFFLSPPSLKSLFPLPLNIGRWYLTLLYIN